jgi:hypothetical protein
MAAVVSATAKALADRYRVIERMNLKRVRITT